MPAISGTALEELSKNYLVVNGIKERLSKRYNEYFLDAIMEIRKLKSTEINEESVHQWLEKFNRIMNTNETISLSFKVILDTNSEDEQEIKLIEKRHGVSHEFKIPKEFFDSGEYKTIMNFSEQLEGLLTSGEAYVQRGEKKIQVNTFAQAHAWLFKESKRGQHIQRYKGLGEMNPEQLWETTLDSEVRRLLQVRIEDAVAADEIFTTLMGDHVEPRRDFIETNALSVSNIDI